MAKLRGGIDLGGTKIQTVVVDAQGNVLGEARQPTPTSGGPADVAQAMDEALREAASAAGIEPTDLAGVGVGSPGDADEKTGVVSDARNLPGWEGSFPLGETLAKALGTRGADRQRRPGRDRSRVPARRRAQVRHACIGVFWGTGVGGGIVLDGKPWLGRGAAGEIGHVVVKHGGAKCPCGRRGCMEAYAGRAAMEAEARRRHEEGEKTDLFQLMRQARQTPPDQRHLGAGTRPWRSPRRPS